MKKVNILRTAEENKKIHNAQFRYWAEKFILAVDNDDEEGIREANEGIKAEQAIIAELEELLESLKKEDM